MCHGYGLACCPAWTVNCGSLFKMSAKRVRVEPNTDIVWFITVLGRKGPVFLKLFLWTCLRLLHSTVKLVTQASQPTPWQRKFQMGFHKIQAFLFTLALPLIQNISQIHIMKPIMSKHLSLLCILLCRRFFCLLSVMGWSGCRATEWSSFDLRRLLKWLGHHEWFLLYAVSGSGTEQRPKADLRPAGEITSPSWLGNIWGFPREHLKHSVSNVTSLDWTSFGTVTPQYRGASKSGR